MSFTLQDVLLRVKEGADIVQIVGQYVPLKRAGSRYLGVCPFHNDRHPSMNVNPRMGIYKCFACGAGGDAIRFVQEFERVGFAEALRLVAAKAGIAVPEHFTAGEKGDADKTSGILKANQIALQVYAETLEKSPSVLAYLQERGLGRETIRHFQIGHAPETPDLILQRARAKKVPEAALVEAGILGEGVRGLYDRFGGRLMFPIFNLSGRVVAFGGRILPGREGSKYVNTPESPLYQKSRVLYGFNFARQAIDQSGEAVIVEGYMDLISLWQAGARNAVAVCGTALTREHAQMLGRFAKKACVFFDGDPAGRNAARRSLEPLLSQGLEIRVPVLPESEDPDSFARGNPPEALQSLFAASEDFPHFWIRSRGKPAAALSPEEKEALSAEAMELLRHCPSGEVRDAHFQALRRLLGLRPAPVRGTPIHAAPAPPSRAPGLFLPGASLPVRPEAVPEWQLLQLLLSYPRETGRLMQMVKLEWFSDGRAQTLFDCALATMKDNGDLSLRELKEMVPETLQDGLVALEIKEGEDPEKIRKLSGDYVRAVGKGYLDRELASTKDLERHLELKKQRLDLLSLKI